MPACHLARGARGCPRPAESIGAAIGPARAAPPRTALPDGL